MNTSQYFSFFNPKERQCTVQLKIMRKTQSLFSTPQKENHRLILERVKSGTKLHTPRLSKDICFHYPDFSHQETVEIEQHHNHIKKAKGTLKKQHASEIQGQNKSHAHVHTYASKAKKATKNGRIFSLPREETGRKTAGRLRESNDYHHPRCPKRPSCFFFVVFTFTLLAP